MRIPGCQNCTLVGTRKIQLNFFVGSGNMNIAHVDAPLVPGMGFRASGMQGKHCPYELYHVFSSVFRCLDQLHLLRLGIFFPVLAHSHSWANQ